jgi:hypothetical protein
MRRTTLVVLSCLLSIAVLIILCGASSWAQAGTPNRVISAVDDSQVSRLRGNLHPLTQHESDLGAVSGSMMLQRMKLVFRMTPAQKSDLERLLREQQDRKSALYHRWLTPQQYGERFGLSRSDFGTVAKWLEQQGFRIVESPGSRTWLAFSGSAAQVQAAFHTEIHQFSVDGVMHYANATEPAVPTALAGVVAAIAQLNDFAPRPRLTGSKPHLTSSLSGNHFLVPSDFATIYDIASLYSNGIDGTGQSIAIVGQSDLSVDTNPGRNGQPGVNGQQYDVVTFRNLANLPAVNLQVVLVPGSKDPGIVDGDVVEANLDVEWSGAIAYNAKLIYVVANAKDGGAFDSILYAVDQNLAPVISVSYGTCEKQIDGPTLTALESAGQQANAQGQTIVASSGDSGAADCDYGSIATHGLSVDVPASLPYVTGMGGTEFEFDDPDTSDPTLPTQFWDGATNDLSGSAFSYIFEQVWNDTATNGTLSAGGGGVSTKFTKPDWQTGPGVPADGQRDVPDISFSSSPDHDGYLLCSQSSCVQNYRQSDQSFFVIGGTSAASPAFAGVMALLNQKFAQSQGNINPTLYTQAVSNSWAFHDIVTGDNQVPCQAGTPDCPSGGSIGYQAGAAYDLASGLGSVDVMALVNAINGTPQPDFWLSPDFRAVQLTIGAGFPVDTSVFPLQGFNGSVDLSCTVPSSWVDVQCVVFPTTVSPPGGTTLFIQTGYGFLGEHQGTVTLSSTSGGLNHQVGILVTLNFPDFQISPQNNSLTIASSGNSTDLLTITATQGYQSTVGLSCSVSSSLGATTCSLNPISVVANASPSTSTLTIIAATNSTSSALTGTVTVEGQGSSGALVHNTPISVTISPGDFQISSSSQSLSLSSGGSGNATITIASTDGFSSNLDLTCTVSSGLGATTCSLSPTSLPGTGTSTLTVHAATLAARLDKSFPFSPRAIGLESSLLFAAVLLIPGKRHSSRANKRRLWTHVLGLFAISLLSLTISCGGGSSSGAPVHKSLSGTVTVQGASGSLNHTVQLTVLVN